MRLLIVEDEERIAELVRSALTRGGFTVDVLNGSADAEAALQTTSYDAVILDLGLPDGDGLERLRLRADATPVLTLTAGDSVAGRVTDLNPSTLILNVSILFFMDICSGACARPPGPSPRNGQNNYIAEGHPPAQRTWP